MRRPIKAHLVNQSNQPVNRSNRSIYRSKLVTHAILNLDLNSNRSNRPVYRYEPVELSFLNLNLNLTGFYRQPVKPVRFTRTGALRFGVTGWEKNPVHTQQAMLSYKKFRAS